MGTRRGRIRVAATGLALVLGGCAGANDIEVATTVVADASLAVETDDGDMQVAEVAVKPRLEADVGRADIVIAARARGDAADELEPGQPDPDTRADINQRALIGDHAELELREAYIRLPVEKAIVTVGKQETVWGRSDGLKVLDVVNPQSFREFILADFDESRIPLWTFKVERRFGPITGQLLWIPDPTYADVPDGSSAFALTAPRFRPPVPPPGVPVGLKDPATPESHVSDSDFGARLTTFWEGFDLSMNYLYHYGDEPVFRVEQSPTLTTITPVYDRRHLVGGTVSRPVGDVTLRAEVTYSFGTLQNVALGASPDGLAESDTFAYVLGADYYGFADTLLSVQLFQDLVVDDLDGLIRRRMDSFVTFYAQRRFANDRWLVELKWLTDVNERDGLVRPSVSYDLSDYVRLKLGADIFYGDDDGIFGQFQQASRVMFRTRVAY